MSAYALAAGHKISISLTEYLAIVFKEDEPQSSFENNADDKLDQYAKRKFEEMKKAHG